MVGGMGTKPLLRILGFSRDKTHRNIEMDEVKRFAPSILVGSESGQRRQTVGSHWLVTTILAAYPGK